MDQTKQLLKSFCLEGKITTKHAQEIEELLDKAFKAQREEMIEIMKKMPTGMFDSTPYLKDIIHKLKTK